MFTRAVRKFKAGIHPGAHIALSLIISLVGIILTSFFGPWFQSSWYGDDESDSDSCSYQFNSTVGNDVYVCNDGTDANNAANPQYVHERNIAYAAAIITYIIAVIHFVLFVGACVDTSRVNAVASRPIYIIAQPQGLHNMIQGWQPIQQAPVVQAPVVQAPIQTTTRDIPPTEAEDQANSNSTGKGKEVARDDDIVEHYAPSGSQA
jgi:hypothetical protein